MDEVLKLLKLDLGITHNKRDTYFIALLDSAVLELERKGIALSLAEADDQMLLSDYAAWLYRKRQDDVPLARNLKLRLMNRKVRARAQGVAENE